MREDIEERVRTKLISSVFKQTFKIIFKKQFVFKQKMGNVVFGQRENEL